MMHVDELPATGYEHMACATAQVLELPQPLVEYVLLERVYRQTPDLAVDYMEKSALHPLICQLKGSYLVVPGIDRLYLYFTSGLTLSAHDAHISWQDLFRQAYGSYNAGHTRQIEYILDRAEICNYSVNDWYYFKTT